MSNVNGYVTSAHQLYGIDAGRRAFMMSEDDGLTWYSTSTQRFTWATSQAADYVPVVTVPWVRAAGLTSAAPVSPYVVASWGGAYGTVTFCGIALFTRVLCSNAAKTRNPLKFEGVLQTRQQVSAVSRPNFTILSGHVEEVLKRDHD